MLLWYQQVVWAIYNWLFTRVHVAVKCLSSHAYHMALSSLLMLFDTNVHFWRAICSHIVTWASWRLKSPVYELFVQQLPNADNKETIIGLHYWSFVRGIHRWPSQRASDAGNVCIWWNLHAFHPCCWHWWSALHSWRVIASYLGKCGE